MGYSPYPIDPTGGIGLGSSLFGLGMRPVNPISPYSPSSSYASLGSMDTFNSSNPAENRKRHKIIAAVAATGVFLSGLLLLASSRGRTHEEILHPEVENVPEKKSRAKLRKKTNNNETELSKKDAEIARLNSEHSQQVAETQRALELEQQKTILVKQMHEPGKTLDDVLKIALDKHQWKNLEELKSCLPEGLIKDEDEYKKKLYTLLIGNKNNIDLLTNIGEKDTDWIGYIMQQGLAKSPEEFNTTINALTKNKKLDEKIKIVVSGTSLATKEDRTIREVLIDLLAQCHNDKKTAHYTHVSTLLAKMNNSEVSSFAVQPALSTEKKRKFWGEPDPTFVMWPSSKRKWWIGSAQ
jgi:Tfp pilus assembly protein PilN